MATPVENVLTEEEKELVEKMNKVLDSQTNVASNGNQYVRLAVANSTIKPLLLKEAHLFSGHWQDSGLPASLERNEQVSRFHECDETRGSKVGVAYFADGERWIFAWDAPIQDPNSNVLQNKMYFEHGPDTDGPIDWKAIEQKLDASTPPVRPIFNPYVFIFITQVGREGRLIVVFAEPKKTSPNN